MVLIGSYLAFGYISLTSRQYWGGLCLDTNTTCRVIFYRSNIHFNTQNINYILKRFAHSTQTSSWINASHISCLDMNGWNEFTIYVCANSETASIYLNAKFHHFFEFEISCIALLSTIDALDNVSVHIRLDPRSPQKLKSAKKTQLTFSVLRCNTSTDKYTPFIFVKWW